MIRALWTSASGMIAQQMNLDVTANNLANVNTTGFKKNRAEFEDLMYQNMKIAGATNQTGNQLPVAVARLKLVTPPVDEPLVRGDDGFFRAAQGDALPNDETARLLSGSIEGSNVNTVETMVGMIAASRQFEQQMKLLQTAETNDKSASQLLSLNG